MCSGPAWKREVVPDHKFDFIDVREFHSKSISVRLRYLLLYGVVLKSFLVYMSDIFTATTYLTTKDWSNQIQKSCTKDSGNGCVAIPFTVAKWLFVGCIIFSFLLLCYEGRKAKRIIASRDISYAFTNVMANNYYSLRSYDHFCLFCTVSNSTKKKDDFAFFVFFTFKGWKRLLLADGPRQSINAIILYGFYLSKLHAGPVFDLKKYSDNFVTSGLIIATMFTVLVFAISMILLIAAAICYVPLLCYIQGNLKEYCCHKVDKRIAELIKRKNKQRRAKEAALAKKEAAGDFSHLRNKKGELIANALPQPTLPNVSLDDDNVDMGMRKGPYPPGAISDWPSEHKGMYAQSMRSVRSEYPEYPPPMPEYQPYSRIQPPGAYATYGPSVTTLSQDDAESDYGSVAHLPNAATAVPYENHISANSLPNPYSSGGSSVPTPMSDAYGGMSREQNNATPYDPQYGRRGR